ncbi:DUF2865 domain-containing protein [Aquibium microcysteis]|uniref:DUF2865 domain-containing protein n=1 Tax=Aquibium microcysteis TaxID=675281 RepID=UPI00165D28B0|nr:DUF2865 domain-containing protein [Aquibium microcysteis]
MAATARRALRGTMLAVVLAALGPLAVSDAAASSRLCRDLEGQLARAGSTGGSPARARQYEKAIGDQLRQIDRVETQLRRAGCSGFFGNGSGQACPSLRSTLQRMNANLASLQRKSRQVSGGGRDGSAARARIMASLDANGCRDTRADVRDGAARARGGPSFLDRLFGGGIEQRRPDDFVRAPADEDRERQRIVIQNGSRIEIRPRFAGTFRTLCVRTCDGYFFPVAYSSSADELGRDAAACQAQCPGTEVELYVHRTPDEEADRMVSLSGVPYTALPTAFRYRQAGYVRPETCGCGAPRNFAVIAGDHSAPADPAGETPPETAMVPLPRPRPDPAMDPESLANSDGGLDRAAILAIVAASTPDPAPAASTEDRSTASTGAAAPAGERRIRVVGPAFLPDQEAEAGLQAPAPGLVR